MSTCDQKGRAVVSVFSLKEEADGKDVTTLLSHASRTRLFLVSQMDISESVLRVTGTNENWKISYENSTERYQSGLKLMYGGDERRYQRAIYTRLFYPEGSCNGSGANKALNELRNDVLGLPKEDLDERTNIAIEMSKNFAY